jgi:hypothetical protein
MNLVSRFCCIAVALIGIGACTDSTEPVDEFPSFFGTWAGKEWSGDASAMLVPGGAAGDTLYVGAATPVNAGQSAKETIMAKFVIHGTGTYLLGPGAARLDELVGGDVLAASYSTTATSVGRIEITKYDGVNGLVSGKIQFDAETSSPYGSYGSKARLENGFFYAVVKEISH